MKPKDKILTYQQARELKWFMKNCTGIRQEYYDLLEKVTAFGRHIDRLNKTCLEIEEFFKESESNTVLCVDSAVPGADQTVVHDQPDPDQVPT